MLFGQPQNERPMAQINKVAEVTQNHTGVIPECFYRESMFGFPLGSCGNDSRRWSLSPFRLSFMSLRNFNKVIRIEKTLFC